MQTRNSWGIVYMAAVFAILVIGTAFTVLHFERKARLAHVIAISQNFSDWKNVSDIPTSTPRVPTSSGLSNDVAQGYIALTAKGTFTAQERDAMIAQAIQKNVSIPSVVPIVSQADLTIGTTSVGSYLALLSTILNRSTSVKHYELDVFTNTVANDNASGTPELANDANLYKRIAAAILVMEVPPQLAEQHLEVVRSMGALANATEKLSTWNGDPIDALTLADTFNKAEAYMETSIDALLAAAQKSEKENT